MQNPVLTAGTEHVKAGSRRMRSNCTARLNILTDTGGRTACFINLRFLQKMDYQKTEWDQARFSSLVLQFADKSNSLRREIISKLPGGMALFVGL